MLADCDVAIASNPPATFTVPGFIPRLRRARAIDIAVVHAECGRNEHRIVDLQVGSAERTRLLNIFRSNVLAPFRTNPAMTSRAFSLGEMSAF